MDRKMTAEALLAIFAVFLGSESLAATSPLLSSVESILKLKFPGTRIEILSQSETNTGKNIRFLSEPKPGEALFETDTGKFTAKFSAWLKVPVALVRIRPLEKLDASKFQIQEVDVSKGMARELKGLALSPETKFSEYQATQTILEGYFALTSGVRKNFAIERGQAVKILLSSGEIQIQSPGTAEEPGYIGDTIRVLSSGTKRELVGKLKDNAQVEVDR